MQTKNQVSFLIKIFNQVQKLYLFLFFISIWNKLPRTIDHQSYFNSYLQVLHYFQKKFTRFNTSCHFGLTFSRQNLTAFYASQNMIHFWPFATQQNQEMFKSSRYNSPQCKHEFCSPIVLDKCWSRTKRMPPDSMKLVVSCKMKSLAGLKIRKCWIFC